MYPRSAVSALVAIAASIALLSPALAAPAKASWSANIKVPYRSWLPQQKPRLVLLCVHGLGFSSQSYTGFGRVMASSGVAVYAVDVRGFGEWINKKENKVNFEGCLTDLEQALKTLHKEYPGIPVFLVGESMGGAIALAATSRYPQLVNGLISSVPSSDRYAKVKSSIVVGAHFLTNKDKPINIGPEVVSRATANEALRKKWEGEKLNRMTITPRELKQFDDFMKGNYDAAALIERAPVLMLAGFKDKLVKPEGTIELFNSVSSKDKLLMVVGDGEHLMLEENQLTEQLLSLILDWLNNEAHSKHPGVTAHQ
jgi:alpha-beta hydrolase superfamily lysophospholipase